MERERRTLAAEVHDGLAQYLAVARRELALPEPDTERLREAVEAAHRLVRARLQELSTDTPAGLREAIERRRASARASPCASPGTARPGRRRSRSPRASSPRRWPTPTRTPTPARVDVRYAATRRARSS